MFELARVRTCCARSILAAIIGAVLFGCSSPAQDFVERVTTESATECKAGNQAACHTIVQKLGDTKVGIESTGTLDILTDRCNRGDQAACQQTAVMNAELSSWCTRGNSLACGAVETGPWPRKWDQPALIDAARISCMNGKFKPDSNTCRSLDSF